MIVDDLAADECSKGSVAKVSDRDGFADDWCTSPIVQIGSEVERREGADGN